MVGLSAPFRATIEGVFDSFMRRYSPHYFCKRRLTVPLAGIVGKWETHFALCRTVPTWSMLSRSMSTAQWVLQVSSGVPGLVHNQEKGFKQDITMNACGRSIFGAKEHSDVGMYLEGRLLVVCEETRFCTQQNFTRAQEARL